MMRTWRCQTPASVILCWVELSWLLCAAAWWCTRPVLCLHTPDRSGNSNTYAQSTCNYEQSSLLSLLPSVYWRCWLGGRKGIRPVKNWVAGVACLLAAIHLLLTYLLPPKNLRGALYCHCHSVTHAARFMIIFIHQYQWEPVAVKKNKS